MDYPSADGEDELHCDPVRRPLPGSPGTEYWIGEFGESYDTPVDRLFTDTVVIDWGNEEERMTQAEFLKLWNEIEPGLDIADTPDHDHTERELDVACAFCDRMLVSVPRIDAECKVCGASKHDIIRMKWEYYVDIQSRPPGQREQVFDIPIHTVLFKDGITCPEGHYLCWFCMDEVPDKRPLEDTDLPTDIDPVTEQ